MSSQKSRFSLVIAASSLVLGACATTSGSPEAPVDLATLEQRAAAERADPLTRARFWAGEYQKEPENIETARYFAKALREIESHERVVQVASDTLILYPADYDMLMLLGRSYLSLGKPDQASQAFGRAIQADNTRADAFAALGLAYDRAGQHSYAQRAYGRALSIDPNRTATLTNYGLSQALSGNIDGAEEALRRAASMPDADSRVRQNLALVLGLQGKFNEMKTIDAAAPSDVMENNAKVLQRMIEKEAVIPPSATDADPVTKPSRSVPVASVDPAPSTPVEAAGLEEIAADPKPTIEQAQAETLSAPDKAPDAIETIDVADYLETAPKGEEKPEGEQRSAGLPGLRGSLVE